MNCQKKSLIPGEFIAAAHDARDERRASGFVWPAVNTHQVKFREPQRFIFFRRNLNYLPF